MELFPNGEKSMDPLCVSFSKPNDLLFATDSVLESKLLRGVIESRLNLEDLLALGVTLPDILNKSSLREVSPSIVKEPLSLLREGDPSGTTILGRPAAFCSPWLLL
uniref:Orf:PZA105 protein n=1 Tax=Saccharomyces cerevisiae TaxID=4932 RepID=E9PAB9_YEASX|nr:orf:PZA105 [Saccharomyces cerevisiae]